MHDRVAAGPISRALLSLVLAAACSAPVTSVGAPTSSPVASASAPLATIAAIERKITVDGRERSYLLYVPRSIERANPAPLVIDLHGSGGTATAAERDTQLSVEAERQHFVVAYPQGLFNIWNAGCCNEAFAQKIDDVAFMTEIIKRTEVELSIDADRVYVAGLSAGAAMAYRIACEQGGLIAAIGSISGSLVTPECTPRSNVSILEIHGTADTTSPYDGCSPTTVPCGNPAATRPAVESMMARVRALFGCPVPTLVRDGPVMTTSASPCRGGTEIRLVTAEGGVHLGPLASVTGSTLSNADVPTVLKFFFEHPRPPAQK